MRLGLGTGSTVAHFLELLADRVRTGLAIVGVPTSIRTEVQAARLGIPLTTLEENPELDLCIDGADEVDPRVDCLKGLGGACVREKIVAAASKRFLIMADASKLVARLGEKAPVVVEVLPFAARTVARRLADLNPVLRRGGPEGGGAPYLSDNGNHVLELRTGPIADPSALGARLDGIPGVLDHGLFLGMAQSAFIAEPGGVRRIDRPESR